MTRSLKKNPFVANNLLKKINLGERRELNPRMVDSQSTALIHLATSAPTPAQVSVSIYDQILSELPYDRYQREAFSYTIVASLLFSFRIR